MDIEKFKSNLGFELHPFQIEAYEHIKNNNNIILNVPTSSGKTTVAEIAIRDSLIKYPGSQAYYTCPIKALANQVYYDLSKKYEKEGGEITVGIQTGDISLNASSSDILVCTAEILASKLMNNNNKENKKEESTVKLENKQERFISSVILDEIHFLSDGSRGHVWEKIIVLISSKIPNCSLILMSGTIGNVDSLLNWMNEINPERKCKSIIRTKRPVELRSWFINFEKCRNFKKEKKKTIDEIKKNRELNRMDIIQNDKIIISQSTNDPNKDQFDLLEVNSNNYDVVKKYWGKLEESEYSFKYELQTLCNTIASSETLGTPAIIFVFSKAKCSEFAELLEQSYVTYKEREEILNFYDENLKEFKDNSQYINLRKIIGKGIAYHNSSLLPKVKECIEFLLKKRLIKFLFGTETVSIGINASIKTAVITGIQKPSENEFRHLFVSEYKQMVGRAGRLGIDKFGNVVLWLMGYKNKKYPSWNELNNILNGKIDNVTSKYTIEPIFVLKNLEDRVHTIVSNNSLAYYKSFRSKKKEITVPPKLTKIYNLKMQMIGLEKNGLSCNMKSYNKLYKALSNDEKKEFELILKTQKENELKTDLDYYDDFERDIYNFLLNNNFIEKNEGKYILTEKGNLAELFTEINPIIFVNDKEFILKEDVLPALSMFIDDGLKESEDDIENYSVIDNETIQYFMEKCLTTYSEYIDKYPKWTFYPKNYVFLSYWLSDENISLDQAVKDFGYDMGTITKVLIKMYQVSEELINNLIKINRTDMTEYVVQQRSLLIRYPLRLESLYVNN